MNIPIVRLSAIVAVGTIALLAQAGMTSTAAVASPTLLPASHLIARAAATHRVVAGHKTTPAKGSSAANGSGAAQAGSAARCDGITNNTPIIQAAINAAGKQPGGVVTIPAGLCVLQGNLHLNTAYGVTVQGAGATRTFIVQHADQNIFQITSPGNTVEDMNLNTYSFNPGLIPIRKNPVPAVLFSNASNTTVMNITAETGSGFGLRLTGSNPCYAFPITGSVVSNVTMVNHGTGGFAAVDIDCQNGARLSNITIHGGILALFNDTNTVVNAETYYGVARCQPAWFVTGPASNILIENVVTYGGYGVIHGSRHGVATGITVVNETFGSTLHC